VVAVTGHDEGQFYLWRLKDSDPPAADSEGDLGSVPLSFGLMRHKTHSAVIDYDVNTPEDINNAGSAAVGGQTNGPRLSRQLYVSYTPTKTHRAHITALRLCSTSTTVKGRDMVAKSFDDSRALDLLVGDADGYVSRWSPSKLDQLPHSDLQGIVRPGP